MAVRGTGTPLPPLAERGIARTEKPKSATTMHHLCLLGSSDHPVRESGTLKTSPNAGLALGADIPHYGCVLARVTLQKSGSAHGHQAAAPPPARSQSQLRKAAYLRVAFVRSAPGTATLG